MVVSAESDARDQRISLERERVRRADKRGCEGTYRAARRNEAKRLGYVWGALRRTVLATGAVVVTLPM